MGVNIRRLSWSSKRKNHLVNFYALEPDRKGQVDVLSPQFSWASLKDARDQISLERNSRGLPAYEGRLLHVVLDMSSGRLYLPNGETKRTIYDDPALTTMYDAVRLKAEKLIDALPNANPIPGDPIDTFRIRRIGDFASVAEFIRRQSRDRRRYESDISVPVIEANLSLMPATAAALFGGNGGKAVMDKWTFVGKGGVFNFLMRQGESDIIVHQQKPPFIVINVAPDAHVSNADKERFVVTGYREYAAQERPDDPSTPTSPQLQSFKYLMYIGWSMRELSLYVLNEADVPDFQAFLFRSAFLYNAAKSLKADGYPDPSANPYYYSFRVGEDFPVAIRPQAIVDVYDYSRHPGIFQVVFFDAEKSYVTFKTPIYIPQPVLEKVFKPKSDVFVSQYDPTDKDVKTNMPAQQHISDSRRSFRAIALDVSNVTGRKFGTTPFRDRRLIDMQFERKHITDYPQAADVIRDLCRKLSDKPDPEARAVPDSIRFDDLEVVVGPWEHVAGFLGGYLDAKKMEQKSGKKSIEVIPGMLVVPPVIAIDNSRCPSVGDRTHVIIHEYRHHINSQLWIKSDVFGGDVLDEGKDTPEQRRAKMVRYLRDPNEHVAHKTQFKYMLAMGMSKEQVLRQAISGHKPTISDVPIVREYLRIINEAASELDLDRSEQESAEVAMEEIGKREQEAVENVSFDFFDPETPFAL